MTALLVLAVGQTVVLAVVCLLTWRVLGLQRDLVKYLSYYVPQPPNTEKEKAFFSAKTLDEFLARFQGDGGVVSEVLPSFEDGWLKPPPDPNDKRYEHLRQPWSRA